MADQTVRAACSRCGKMMRSATGKCSACVDRERRGRVAQREALTGVFDKPLAAKARTLGEGEAVTASCLTSYLEAGRPAVEDQSMLAISSSSTAGNAHITLVATDEGTRLTLGGVEGMAAHIEMTPATVKWLAGALSTMPASLAA